jgi:hypothetical protein
MALAVFMLRLLKMRRVRAVPLVLASLAALLLTRDARAQAIPPDDSNDAPLGDVARQFRKKSPPEQDVIDNDNLPKVMEQARRVPGPALKFVMAGESKSFRVATPDATCSLAFTANARSLLSNQYAQMNLPASEMPKLEGPATIEGNSLIIAMFNGTDWHVSEVAVALTIVRKSDSGDAAASFGGAKLIPAVAGGVGANSDERPGDRGGDAGSEKKPDLTVIYRMRAAAPPSTTTVFSAPLNLDLGPGEEWHWALVEAKGYPPQSYAGGRAPVAAQSREFIPAPSALPAALATPQASTTGPATPAPQ